MNYKDKKWLIIHNDKDGLRINIQCECGNKHDIHLDSVGNFQGRGTLLGKSGKVEYPNLRDDICSFVKAELITMSRAREILEIKYMEDMRDVYNKYHKRIMGEK